MGRRSLAPAPSAAARFALPAAAAFVLLVAVAVVLSSAPRVQGQRMPDPNAERDAGLPAQLERGRDVYAFSCTTCHGASGQGFAEARSAFPDDHYHCSRCHMPLNPPAMTPAEIEAAQSTFSLGDPPPLADGPTIARYGSAAALYAYVRATMPRWDPGRLGDEAFLDVTAYVLHLAGGTLTEELTFENAAAFDLADLLSD